MKQLTRQRNNTDDDLVEFETAATRLEQRLDKLGVTEEDLLKAADKVRERMLAEVYGLGVDELVQP
ncbi:MAG TPA: hypothetical protein VN687_05925 [Blastocatellia bacterium]|nr:hypothetical protein [Blastocatellia bacterium]